MGQNLYEVLGIANTASIDDIKVAYRNRARQIHPDKGGSAKDFNLLNFAFKILSNSKSRMMYDATGEAIVDPPFEKAVEAALMGLFEESMQHAKTTNPLNYVKNYIDEQENALQQNILDIGKIRVGLSAQRGRVIVVGDNIKNVFHLLIDSKMRNLDGQLEMVNYRLDMIVGIREALVVYEAEEPIPVHKSVLKSTKSESNS